MFCVVYVDKTGVYRVCKSLHSVLFTFWCDLHFAQHYWNWNKRGSCEVIHRSFPRVTAISVLALFYTAAQRYLLYWIVDFRMSSIWRKRIKRMCGPLVSTCRFSVWAYLALLTCRCFLWCHYGLLSLCCLSVVSLVQTLKSCHTTGFYILE